LRGRIAIERIVDIAVIVTDRAKSALKSEHHLLKKRQRTKLK